MKVIAITQRLVRETAYLEVRDALDVNWIRLVETAGAVPLALPSLCNLEQQVTAMNVAGIVLTGGPTPGDATDVLNGQRDRFEEAVLTLALKKGLPVLGVCRGMQMVTKIFGGSWRAVPGHVRTCHDLKGEPGSCFADLLAKQTRVNSYHQFGVDRIPEGFVVSARGTDGVIEAMEHKVLPLFCQMWHPEREDPFHVADVALFRTVLRL